MSRETRRFGLRGVPFRCGGPALAAGLLLLASGLRGQEVASFSSQSRELLGPSGGQVWSLAFAPGGGVLGVVTGTQGGSRGGPGELQLYAVAGGRRRAGVGEPAGRRALTFAPDGRGVATAGFDGVVKIRDAADGAVRATLGGPGPAVNSVAFSPDGKTL